MWPKAYRDYKNDSPLIKNRVEPTRGIIGCEMHECNGWGNSLHRPPLRSKGAFSLLLERWFGGKKR